MPSPFVPVTLQTHDRRHVTRAEVPPFIIMPTVLIWGQRVFTLDADGDPMNPVYVEAEFTYTVPIYAAEGTPGSWRDQA
jgi:hypothetical protein